MKKKEPPIPKDSLCVVCKKPLIEIKRYGAGAEDAFCSTGCCREFFETQTATDVAITSK
jgi:hypothetical protein